ncbi:MAG: hypothetical protein QOH84_565 [Kribbellaceae bacterium]|nr:hypothetical protein [Kribbellaceae bacterium]
MRGEIRAVREGLNANWVSVYGSDVQRLRETAEEALRTGLKVSVQPRAFDQPQVEALEQLRQTARELERLRKRYEPEAILVIGCEFMLFTPGIVPGADFYERVEYLTKGEFDMAELQRKLSVYVAKAVKVARSNFKGRITYGAASDLEEIDWKLFDIVGLDYYSYHAPSPAPRRWAGWAGTSSTSPSIRSRSSRATTATSRSRRTIYGTCWRCSPKRASSAHRRTRSSHRMPRTARNASTTRTSPRSVSAR